MNTYQLLGFITLGIGFILSVADWIAVLRKASRLEAIFKPTSIAVILLAAVLLAQGPHDQWQILWFVPAFAFSFLGDVFLLRPASPRSFLMGLLSFLAAHICFIIGFNPTFPPLLSFIPAVILWTINSWFHYNLLKGLDRAGKPAFKIPVSIYSMALGLLLLSALATFFRPEWSLIRRFLALIGAVLFVVSDTILGWEQFVTPGRPRRVWIMITYHLAQISLAASIAVYN